MNDRLKALYKSVIIKESNTPAQFEKNEGAQHALKAHSPVCGDRFTLFFDLEKGIVKDLTFYGHGCAVSKASTSIMVQKLVGITLEEALKMCDLFYAHLETEKKSSNESIEEFEAFSAVQYFPERKQCATLSWDEIATFLKSQT